MGSLGWLPYLPLIEVGVFYEHPIASSAILSKIEGNDWYERLVWLGIGVDSESV